MSKGIARSTSCVCGGCRNLVLQVLDGFTPHVWKHIFDHRAPAQSPLFALSKCYCVLQFLFQDSWQCYSTLMSNCYPFHATCLSTMTEVYSGNTDAFLKASRSSSEVRVGFWDRPPSISAIRTQIGHSWLSSSLRECAAHRDGV